MEVEDGVVLAMLKSELNEIMYINRANFAASL